MLFVSEAVTTIATAVGLCGASSTGLDGAPAGQATLLTARRAPWSFGSAVTVTLLTPAAAVALYSSVRGSKVGLSEPEDSLSDCSVASWALLK